MAALEHLGDLIDPLGPRRGVAGGRAQIDVAEARGDLVDRNASLEQVRRPVGPERVRVRQRSGHASGLAVAEHKRGARPRGEGERLLIAVAAEAHEQRLLVEQPNAVGQRMDVEPGVERLLDGLGDGIPAFAPAFATT